MRFKTSLTLSLLTTIFVGSPAVAGPRKPDNDQVKKEIEAAYAKRDQAFKDKNSTAIKSMWTSDYKQKTKDGEVIDRSIVEPQTEQLLAMVKDIKILSTTVDKVTEGKSPNEYIAEATSKGDFTLTAGDGALHEIVASAKIRDTWVQTKDGWKMKYHEELEAATLLDGKPIN